jgi:hypothetical protein
MKTPNPAFRFGLLALTGAIVLGTATLQSRPQSPAAASAMAAIPTVTLGAITVRPDAEEIAAAQPLPAPSALPRLPMLPVVRVSASEEEILAARIDPSDRIQILSAITVQPSAEEIDAAMRGADVAQAAEDNDRDFGSALHVVTGPHRLRLDMPYYSFGKILTRDSK